MMSFNQFNLANTASPSQAYPFQQANASMKPRPKRPLSGYNLFYRYKRNMILEATAHLITSDTNAIINTVLTAPPGLENVNVRDHPLWTSYPPQAIDKLRASNIRASMEGKIFPKENTRSRQHRKVHGMGFEEMNKTMRVMWGGIDELTKAVFCEMADVGRTWYRKLLAEWKMGGEDGLGDGFARGEKRRFPASMAPMLVGGISGDYLADQPSGKRLKTMHPNINANMGATGAGASAAAMGSLAPLNIGTAEKPQIVYVLLPTPPQAQAIANLAYPTVPTFPSAHSTMNKMGGNHLSTWERMVMAGTNPATAFGMVPPNRPSVVRRVSNPADLNPLNGVDPLSNGSAKLAAPADVAPPKRPYGRRVSDPEVPSPMNGLEPISIGTANPVAGAAPPMGPRYARRVSHPDDSSPENGGSATAPVPVAADRGGGVAANAPPAPPASGNGGVLDKKNALAGLMMNHATAAKNKAAHQTANEFQRAFQQLLAKDAAMIQNSARQNNGPMPTGVKFVPASQPFQPAPQQQQAFSQEGGNDHPKITAPGPAWLNNYIDATRSSTESTDGSCNNSVGHPTGVVSVTGSNQDADISSTASESDQDSINSKSEEDVSSQDFIEFIGQLDEALDENDDDCSFPLEKINENFFDPNPVVFGLDETTKKTNGEEDCDSLSFVFGKPMQDVKMNPTTSGVPMPDAFELNESWAQMA